MASIVFRQMPPYSVLFHADIDVIHHVCDSFASAAQYGALQFHMSVFIFK